jgi:glyoxylase-like metal-dependent hydrolase (beta-lactamase superfamily II)
MIGIVQIGMLMQLFLAGAQPSYGGFINIEKLSDRVILAYWVGTDRRCNLTAIKGQKGLAIVDTEMSPRIMAPIKERIEQVFGRKDWAYVINTHAHDNHAGGNSLFKGAVIVGHENLPADMQGITHRQTEHHELERATVLLRNLRAFLPQVARNREQARMVRGEIKFWELYTQDLREGYKVVKPTLMFADTQTLDLGDLQLELTFFGKGHSNSDILIHVPQERLLVCGAVVYQRAQFPEVAEETTLQDVHRFIAVLDRFLAEDAKIDHVVPCHSLPLLKSDLAPVRDYYQRMLTGMQAARGEGLTLEQTRRRLDPRTNFPAFVDRPPGVWSHGFHERNVTNLWRILSEEEQKLRADTGKTVSLPPGSSANGQ